MIGFLPNLAFVSCFFIKEGNHYIDIWNPTFKFYFLHCRWVGLKCPKQSKLSGQMIFEMTSIRDVLITGVQRKTVMVFWKFRTFQISPAVLLHPKREINEDIFNFCLLRPVVNNILKLKYILCYTNASDENDLGVWRKLKDRVNTAMHCNGEICYLNFIT